MFIKKTNKELQSKINVLQLLKKNFKITNPMDGTMTILIFDSLLKTIYLRILSAKFR